jgi:hypothetical protein
MPYNISRDASKSRDTSRSSHISSSRNIDNSKFDNRAELSDVKAIVPNVVFLRMIIIQNLISVKLMRIYSGEDRRTTYNSAENHQNWQQINNNDGI